MSATMAKDTARLVVTVSAEVRDALKLAALLRGIDMGDVITQLAEGQIEGGLVEELEQIRERRNPPDQGPKSRK